MLHVLWVTSAHERGQFMCWMLKWRENIGCCRLIACMMILRVTWVYLLIANERVLELVTQYTCLKLQLLKKLRTSNLSWKAHDDGNVFQAPNE